MCSVVISYLLATEDALIECLEIGFEIANYAVVTPTISTSNWIVLPASGLL